MATTQHGQYLHKFTRMIAFNSYLVIEDDGITVVDTNLPGSADAIKAAADALHLPIKRIVVTHAHMDHVASVDDLHALVPDAAFIVPERSVMFLKGEKSLLPDEPAADLRGGYTEVDTAPTRTVCDGDSIGRLRVIATPGHTPGHIALLDERDGTLIAGDAIQTQWGTVVSGKVNWRFPLPAFATWHKPSALASAEKMQSLKPTRLAVGHGPVLENPAQPIAQAVEGAKRAFGG